MANGISIRITNLPQIKAAFSKAPQLMSQQLNIAIKKTLFTVESAGKPTTPVDTGRLRASWYTRFGNFRGETGTNTNYDIFVHNGTRFMRARPYLYNAVKFTENRVENFFTQAVDNVLSDIGRRV